MLLAYIIIRILGDVLIVGALVALMVCDHYSSGRLSKTLRLMDVAVCGIFVLVLFLVNRAMDYPGWVALANCFAVVRVEQYLWYVGPFQPMRAWWVTYRQECWARKLKWYDQQRECVSAAIKDDEEIDCSDLSREETLGRLDRRLSRLNRRRDRLKNKMAVIVP